MACGGCAERRRQLAAAAKAVVAGQGREAVAGTIDVARSLSAEAGQVARAAMNRLAAAHARLKR